ncbi:hypothetical protein Q3W73_03755 [Klebsiella pneumoniae]|uniref:hypothetical protein n=1 Tax=Klebsiella pneumoniae TaxID=573 RepID=UPI002E113764|nr:hypothetical protein Q3W73_03755 [Klebsiella pneumoniae]
MKNGVFESLKFLQVDDESKLFLRLKRTPSRKVRGFLLCGVYLPPVALRLPGLQKRTPDKVRSTASGENYAMFAPLSPFNAK